MMQMRKILRIISYVIYIAAFAFILWSMFFGLTLFDDVEIAQKVRSFLPFPYGEGMYWRILGGLLTTSPLIVLGAVLYALSGGEHGSYKGKVRKNKKSRRL